MNFKKRLSLLGYLRKKFGVFDIHSSSSIKTYYNELNEKTKGSPYHHDGVSKLCRVLQHDNRVNISNEKLLIYDQNIASHVEKINENRERKDRIIFKYFQLLAGFYTEYYLDQITGRKEEFLDELNSFVRKQKDNHSSKVHYKEFEVDDLNKVAFWMATGSGKTLIMHLNYYQFLHYQSRLKEKPDNILLITPNEGLTIQHTKSLKKSGIPCQYYLDSNGESGIDPETIKLIEITKLVDNKTGEGDSIEVSAFEGNNLVFVDEGHKGSGTEDSKWMRRRNTIAKEGFTFEYSATFGQAMNNATASVQDEYGKAIIFDYSYPRFYDDGYGKDYRILNLKKDQTFEDDQQQVYLLANLLTFFEQKYIYKQKSETFYKTWNIHDPLLAFIGHRVQSGKSKSYIESLSDSNDDKMTISDVLKLVLFLDKVLQNQDNWSIQTISKILKGETGLPPKEDGSDIFEDSFSVLRSRYEDKAQDLYRDLLETIFHVSTPCQLKLSDLTSAEGEIGLRAGNSELYFGVINIGDTSLFLSFVKDDLPYLTVDESDVFEDSLFQRINKKNSRVNVLIGSKKFIEGWSSWRVSCMGLLNIGKSEGPQIIQLFGRGVRLLGKDRSLKRSTAMTNEHGPANIEKLETLQIFGLQANYMEKFRDYLEEEGIDTDRRIEINLDIELKDDLEGKGLLVIKPKVRDSFREVKQLVLEVNNQIEPRIDLTGTIQEEASDGDGYNKASAPDSKEKVYIPDDLVPLLNMDRIYREAWYYRSQKGYDNLSFTSQEVAKIITDDLYELYCDKEIMDPSSFKEVKKIEQIALIIVRKYVDSFYKKKQQEWEYTQLEYQPFDAQSSNIPKVEDDRPGYQLRVKEESVENIEQEIEKLFDDDEFLKRDITKNGGSELPHIYFDKHLYLPLLVEDENEVIESTPPGLNEGEWKFIRDLKKYFERPETAELFRDTEVYVLRNQSRGHGVGFLLEEGRFFPDFIVWLKTEEGQHICFMDPKGLVHQINVDQNDKVQFSNDIKEYEKQLNNKSDRDDIFLHSFVISRTDFKDVRKNNSYEAESDYNELGLYFPKDDLSYIDAIFRKILGEEEKTVYNE